MQPPRDRDSLQEQLKELHSEISRLEEMLGIHLNRLDGILAPLGPADPNKAPKLVDGGPALIGIVRDANARLRSITAALDETTSRVRL